VTHILRKYIVTFIYPKMKSWLRHWSRSGLPVEVASSHFRVFLYLAWIKFMCN